MPLLPTVAAKMRTWRVVHLSGVSDTSDKQQKVF
jgi:hypothetical protein